MATTRAGLVMNVADLLHRPGARRRVQQSGTVEALRVVGSTVPAQSAVSVDAVLEWVNEGILATGTATAPFEAECRRCLTAVRGEVTAEFQELFEVEAREGETYPLRGERIDLAPMAQEALLLELPLAPLCREACRGLCPTCGADLNAGACSCPASDRDPRWGALDGFRSDAPAKDS
ncbi:MAG: DUF177 domain-containing protein [Actinomycetota bacterium]|nr:DUF177 domain-containing protein [Actinomycetota bacterium]